MIFEKISSEDLKELRKVLLNFKIETRPFLAGNFSLQPVNKNFQNICFNSLPNLKVIQGNSLALPCHQDITFDQIDKIGSIIENYLKNH